MKLNTKLINSLIASDFILLASRRNKSNRYSQQHIRLSNGKKYVVLDVLVLLTMLKQYIRIFQFLKKAPSKNFHIVLENPQYRKVVEKFIHQNNLDSEVLLTSAFNTTHIKSQKDLLNLVFFVNKFFPSSKNVFKNLYSKRNFFLLGSVNTDINFKEFEEYKIYNNIDDIKKLLFFMVMFLQVFNSSTKK